MGLRVTSPAATAIELAQHLPRPFALSSLDALLHTQIVTRADLEDSVHRLLRQPTATLRRPSSAVGGRARGLAR